jgi:hypothetical protein
MFLLLTCLMAERMILKHMAGQGLHAHHEPHSRRQYRMLLSERARRSVDTGRLDASAECGLTDVHRLGPGCTDQR